MGTTHNQGDDLWSEKGSQANIAAPQRNTQKGKRICGSVGCIRIVDITWVCGDIAAQLLVQYLQSAGEPMSQIGLCGCV